MSASTETNPTGVSLTQDAWRRLRRNRSAMAALYTMAAVVTLAFFTPLLPLQPPDRDKTSVMFAEPRAWPLMQETFRFEPTRGAEVEERLATARETLKVRRRILAFLKRSHGRAESLGEAFSEIRERSDESLSDFERSLLEELVEDSDVAQLDFQEQIDQAIRDVRQARATIVSIVQRPYADAGFPKLDPLARAMVRTRYALFGGWEFNSLCGRDKLGRDILSRIFWGARVSLIVGLVATLVSLVIGVTYGAVAGYAGGWVDNLMMRVVDVLYSIPFVFLAIFIISVLSEDSVKESLESYGVDRITIFYFVVGAIYWLTMARVVRGQVVSLRNEQFIEAAQSLGVSQAAIIFRHLVPNLFSIVLVYLTLTIPRVILFEAFLSYLGMGVEPPDVSWGLLANEGITVITPVRIYWWLIVFPSLAIGATLFALNFLGDGLRDAFDPRMKGR